MNADERLRTVVNVWEMTSSQLTEASIEDNEVHDGAYFVHLFGQLEWAIDGEVTNIYGDADGLSFRERLRLLEGVVDPELLDLIAVDYSLRCDLAHGRVIGCSIDVAGCAKSYLEAISQLG